jgi:ribose transport system substrate-binding protein
MSNLLVRRFGALGLFTAFSGVALALTFSLSIASAQDCEEKTIDLGDGKSVEGGCKPLKIAFLTAATNNVYLQSGIKGGNPV